MKLIIVLVFGIAIIACVSISGASASIIGPVHHFKSYSAILEFGDYCNGFGTHGEKVKVRLHSNGPHVGVDVKKTFKFRDILKHDSKASVKFSPKYINDGVGGSIDVDVKVTGGGTNHGPLNYSFDFDSQIRKYNVQIDLPEFGCPSD